MLQVTEDFHNRRFVRGGSSLCILKPDDKFVLSKLLSVIVDSP